MRFRHTAKFAVSPSNLKNLTASPGVERARKPSGCFFGTFFVEAKKVHIVSHPHGSPEGAHILCVLFWHLFRASEKSAGGKVPPGVNCSGASPPEKRGEKDLVPVLLVRLKNLFGFFKGTF